MKHEPVYLNGAMRRSVKNAIIETCAKRGWHLFALNVRTNHGHSVVANPGKKPDFILSAFKANATRKMREDGCWNLDHSPWAEKGSKRWLWTERAVENAIDYVVNRQGAELPDTFE
jgi:REP element-mobilizing transposase RayT